MIMNADVVFEAEKAQRQSFIVFNAVVGCARYADCR